MENNDRNVARWVEARLAALQPAADFHPDASKALSRVEARERRYQTMFRRWLWTSLAAASVCLALLIAPAPCRAASPEPCGQPVASRLWDSVFHKPDSPAALVRRPMPAPIPVPAVDVAMTASAAKPAPKPVAPSAASPAPAPTPQAPGAPPIFKWTGSPGAPIICEMYSDFECPHCAAVFQQVLPQFIAEFVQTGKVRLLHRDFPLRTHAHAHLAALYANAAGLVGVYDLVTQQLYRTQAEWGRDGDIESRLAPVLSPDALHRIHDLVQHPAELEQIIGVDMAMAAQDHIDSTPSLVVVFGGKRQVFAGFPALEVLRRYLDDLK